MNDFVLHRDHRPYGQMTDADILGVRFPFRKELTFPDDEPFATGTKSQFIIGEITQGTCKLNGPWTDPNRRNMQYVLSAIGAFAQEDLDGVAALLYERYVYEDDNQKVQLIAFGRQIDERFADPAKPLLQLTFEHVCRFIHARFIPYQNEKRDHQHWDYAGRVLWDLAESHRDNPDEFVTEASRTFGFRLAPMTS
jgi:hypothetical protein